MLDRFDADLARGCQPDDDREGGKPMTRKQQALYRCRLTCKIGKDACKGKGAPVSALEDLARAMELQQDA